MARNHPEVDRKLDDFAVFCRDAGLRVTHQRLEIYRELLMARDHPTAEALHRRLRRRMPTLSLDTLYRTLASLEEARLVSRVGTSSSVARFEAQEAPHDHFTCRRCGAIADVSPFDRVLLSGALAAPEGWQVESYRVEAQGLCQSCGPAGKGKTARRK